MQQAGSDVTVIAFIIMPATVQNYAIEPLRGQAIMKTVSETVSDVKERIGKQILEDLLTGKVPSPEQLMTRDDIVQLKRALYSMQRRSLPPVVTHNVTDDHKDQILSHIRRVQLFNNKHDRVKVMFYLR